MLFSSLEFIFLFLPVCIAIYFLAPLHLRNGVLLVFSLIFYGFGEPLYVFLMVLTVTADYLFAIAIERSSDDSKRKRVLAAAVAFNLAILGFFKYYDFLANMLGAIPSLSFIRPLGIPLPVGISFYTFQALSYVCDVYRRDAHAARSPLTLGTYISLFPQLVAGPIVRYGDIAEQIEKREHSFSLTAQGIRRFSAGLAKKVLLANTAGELWQSFAAGFDAQRTDTLYVWFGVVCFAFQIYFDFSGYSDMAIGLGKIFGFSFPENFNYPYTARSISDFWRRWHITLSSFFREYVYIPLGGNRRGRARTYLNLLAVWSLTGLWHGAGLNFILWGLYYFVLLSIEKAFMGKLLEKAPRLICHLYTLILVLIGWLIFAADGTPDSLTLTEALSCIRIMSGLGSGGLYSPISLYESRRALIPLIIMALASLPLWRKLVLRAEASKSFGGYISLAASALSLLALILSIAYLVNSGYNPFLYFRF